MTHTAQTPSSEDELDIVLGDLWSRAFNNGSAHSPKDPTEDITEAKAAILANYRSVAQIEAAYGEDQRPAQQSSEIERILQPNRNRIKWQNELRAQIRKALNLNKKEDK